MMGSNRYMVVIPSLVKQFSLKRSSVLSSEDFIFVCVQLRAIKLGPAEPRMFSGFMINTSTIEVQQREPRDTTFTLYIKA